MGWRGLRNLFGGEVSGRLRGNGGGVGYWMSGIRGLLGGRCGLGRPTGEDISIDELNGIVCMVYLCIDIDDYVVASVRHIGIEMFADQSR